MSDSISQAADALVAEVERVMQADLAALEQRESAFLEHCAQHANLPEPNCSLPEFPDLKEEWYRQLLGECKLLENALRGWLQKVESFLSHVGQELPSAQEQREVSN
jgi:hypothetical protein